jgi:hypothetical protein
MTDEDLTPIVKPPTIKRLGDPRDKDATWTMLPPPPGVCSQCARDHVPADPHDRDSLHYQYAFYAEHDRWPTWGDALAHCDDHIKGIWRDALHRRGVPDEELEPSCPTE